MSTEIQYGLTNREGQVIPWERVKRQTHKNLERNKADKCREKFGYSFSPCELGLADAVRSIFLQLSS